MPVAKLVTLTYIDSMECCQELFARRVFPGLALREEGLKNGVWFPASCGSNGGNSNPEKAVDQSCDPCKELKAKKAAEAKQEG